MKGGVFNPKAAQGWLDAHHSALSELPETRRLFGNAQKMAEAFVDRKLELKHQRQVLDRSVLAKVAGNEQPELLVRHALQDPKIMRGLLEGAYTKESKDAIARSVVDVVLTSPDPYGLLVANKPALKPVMDQLGPNHWDNLMDIAEAQKISSRTRAPTEVELAKLQDVGEKYAGTSVKGMLSRALLVQQNRLSVQYAVTDVTGRFIYKIRSEQLAKLRGCPRPRSIRRRTC
jgi:hypothetical protein